MSLLPAKPENHSPAPPAGTEWVPFNVNDYIRFKITAKGRQMIREQYAWIANATGQPVESFMDAKVRGWRDDEWIEMQLWCFMETFGPDTRIGCGGNFETQIEIQIRQREGDGSQALAGGKG